MVFSLFFFRRCLPERFFSYSTYSRQTFYAKVGSRSFHTAWTLNRHVILAAESCALGGEIQQPRRGAAKDVCFLVF